MRRKVKYLSALCLSFIISGVGIYFYLGSSLAISPAEAKCAKIAVGGEKVRCYAKMYADWGIKEIPAFTNRGATVDFFNKQAWCSNPSVPGDKDDSATYGNPWCASFVSYVLRLGRNSWDVNTCSTAKMVDQFAAKHHVYNFNNGAYKLYAGDVLYKPRKCDGGGLGCGHVGIVYSYDQYNGDFTTIEGNTYCGSNDCVKMRRYYKNGSPKDSDNLDSSKWSKLLRW